METEGLLRWSRSHRVDHSEIGQIIEHNSLLKLHVIVYQIMTFWEPIKICVSWNFKSISQSIVIITLFHFKGFYKPKQHPHSLTSQSLKQHLWVIL